MKMMLKVATAVAAIVAGAQPAQAVRWVEHRVSGYGIVTETSLRSGDTSPPLSYEGFMTMVMVVPLEPAEGEGWSSDGSSYSLSLTPIFDRATYTSESISGNTFAYSPESVVSFSASSGGAMSYEYRQYSAFLRTFVGTADTLVRIERQIDFPQYFGAFVIPATEVPEPATWGLMLVGFGAIGATIRQRRVSFAA